VSKPGDKIQVGDWTYVVGCKHILNAFPEGVIMQGDWKCHACLSCTHPKDTYVTTWVQDPETGHVSPSKTRQVCPDCGRET
jgi:hypothetical protein